MGCQGRIGSPARTGRKSSELSRAGRRGRPLPAVVIARRDAPCTVVIGSGPGRDETLDYAAHEVFDPVERRAVADVILRALPDWFGIESAIVDYVEQVAQTEDMWFWAARRASRPVGFLSLRRHNAYTAEVHCMGLLEEFHRRGIGAALVRTAEGRAQAQGMEFLTVKTLDASHPDAGYAKTRAFYAAMGFRPLEVFPTLWGEENPCVFMAKSLVGPPGLSPR